VTAHSRPDHPDVWLLSEVVLDLDAQADNAMGGDAIDRVISSEVAVYFARQRALRAVQAGLVEPSAEPALAASWLDGLVAGMMLQAKKDQET
jgi:hypothetical protein